MPTNIPVQLFDRFRVKDSFSLAKVSEYYKRNNRTLVLAIVITIASSGVGVIFAGWIGVLTGLFISLLSTMLLPPIREKIREIERS